MKYKLYFILPILSSNVGELEWLFANALIYNTPTSVADLGPLFILSVPMRLFWSEDWQDNLRMFDWKCSNYYLGVLF